MRSAFRLLALPILLHALALSGCKPRLSDTQLSAADGTEMSFFSRFDYDRTRTLLVEQISRQNIRTKLSLFRLNLTDLASLGGRYDYSVSRAEAGEYRRIDRWHLVTAIEPGTLIANAAGQNLPVFLHLEANREVEYSRSYASKTKAMTALPKTLLDAPLSVANATKMQPGDAASLPVRLGVRLGARQGYGSGGVGASAMAGVFWAGDCRLVIMKLDESRVRVKLMPSQSRGFFVAAQLGVTLDMFGYGPFGLINMDRQVERAIGLDLFRYNRELTLEGDKLAIDYVIDLADPVGGQVFEAMVAKTLKLNPLALRDLDSGARDLGSLAFADLGPAEAVHAQDRSLPPESRRVSRVFRGSNAFLGDAGAMRLGTRFWRANTGKSLTLNWLTTSDDDGQDRRHVYHLFSDNRQVTSMFSAVRKEQRLTAGALFDASANWRELRFADLVLSWQLTHRQLKPQEAADRRAAIVAILGSYAEGVDLEELAPSNGAKKYANAMTIVIPAKLIAAMKDLAQRDPELYERQLWMALWAIVPQLQGRFGSQSPGQAVNLRAEMGNFLRRTTESARQMTRNALNLRWEGVRGSTGQDLVNAGLTLPRRDTFEFMSTVLSTLQKDESAHEIVPAYFLALAQVFQVTPYISVTASADDLTPLDLVLGEFTNERLHADVGTSLTSISDAGF